MKERSPQDQEWLAQKQANRAWNLDHYAGADRLIPGIPGKKEVMGIPKVSVPKVVFERKR